MGLFTRRSRAGTTRGADDEGVAHLRAFAGSRRGVEGFVEPETPTTSTTLVLVAHDGEWTRRRVASPRAAFALGHDLAVPVYDVAAVGYPQRMRDWTAAQRRAGRDGG